MRPTSSHDASPFAIILYAAAGVLIANAIFLAVMLVALPDPSLIVQRTREAFLMRDLDQSDYLPWNGARGWHQYNDCNVLQMLANVNGSRTAAAIAPVIYKADQDFNVACPVLYDLAVTGTPPEQLLKFHYARYWHGNNALAGVALRFMPLRELRWLLKTMVWLGVGVLAMVAWRRGARTRLVGVSIAFTAVAFWAVPYFAPGLTHGPGDALLLLAVTALAAWPTLTSSVRSIATYAAVFGAGTVFFSMLTGELPVAAGWLVAVTLAVARDHHGTRRPGAIAIALTAFVAFVLGAVATVAAKQGLSLMLSEPGAFSRFLGQLQQYTSIPPAAFGLPPLLVPYAQLARQIDVLTAGNEALGYSLIAVVLATIGVAAAKGWRFRRTLTGKEILLLVGATFIPVLWVMLLPLHTYIHAGFMVRIMVVPIAIAPAALLWSRCDVRPARVTR